MQHAAQACGVDLIHVSSEPSDDTPHWLPQRGVTFGERVRNAFDDARSLGYEEIIVIPIDVPGLSTADLMSAFDRLHDHDHVLGPSPDGGVYLIGTRVDPSPLLDGVRWNTAFVFADLLERATGAVALRPLRDLDGPADLVPLLAEVEDRLMRAVLASLVAARTPALDRSPLPSWRETPPSSGRAPPLPSRP
ncbi:MAG: hypothetical protein NVSMB68_05490 [Thermoanaerobaculia bacterium]